LIFGALSVALGSVIILIVGENPLRVYGLVLRETLLGSGGYMIAIQRATPLIISAAAATAAFRAGAINMGLSGKFAVGASLAAMAGYGLDLPKPLHIPAVLLISGIGGGLAAMVPAIFREMSGVSEVITGMIANMIIPHLLNAVTGLIPGAGRAMWGASREGIRESAQLAQFVELTDGRVGVATQANTGIFVAIVIIFLLAVWMRYSKLGYEFRVTRLNPLFAEFGGIRAKRYFFLGMVLSGAIAAMAGAVEIMGVWRQPRYGMLEVGNRGLVIALIGQQSYVGSLVGGLLFGALDAGTLKAAWTTSLPRPLIDILVELTIICLALPSMFTFASGDPDSEVDRLGGRFVTMR